MLIIMLISSKHLYNLSVETESGEKLGQVAEFDLDIDSQKIWRYYIKPSLIRGGFLKESLIIHHRQVISITKDKMIVMDNVVKYQDKAMVFDKIKTQVMVGAAG